MQPRSFCNTSGKLLFYIPAASTITYSACRIIFGPMQSLRLLLLPFSFIFGMITSIRNLLFDLGIKKSYHIPGASICVGNITVGGTGKSPMTIYLLELLQQWQPAVLSRGYGRSTKGPILASASDNAHTIGDEPFMYLRRFEGKVPVVVAEARKEGVDILRGKFTNPTIILDDAFQHRHVKAGFQLLLMTYDRPVFSDFPFPAGNLRETRRGMKRADAIVVTKCPDILPETTRASYIRKLGFPEEKVFFSTVRYGNLIPLKDDVWNNPETLILVTGIANPEPLRAHLAQSYNVSLLAFPDHHTFTLKDIQAIHQKVATFADRRCALVTTEKDAVRLLSMEDTSVLCEYPWFYQSMQVQLDRETEFNTLLQEYVIGANERSR